MKEATITLKMDKNLSVVKTGVTPIEALLLVAEHHRGAGENPVEVHKDTVRDIPGEEKETEITEQVEVTEMQGNPPVNPVKVMKTVTRKVKSSSGRTEDEEISRLKTKYHPAKVKALLIEVRNLPKDFDEAMKKGIDLVLPTSDGTFAESGKK